MTKHLTMKQKHEYFPLLIKRDGGFRCFYCKQSLVINSFVYDHLNNNRADNRIENTVLACQSCNVIKKDNYDMQILAKEKLEHNENWNFMGERMFETESAKEASTEININVTNFEITERHLSEIIQTDGEIEFSDALNSCVFLCKRKTGHGSQQSVRNYLDTLTSSVGPFMITKNENKKKVIVTRVGI